MVAREDRNIPADSSFNCPSVNARRADNVQVSDLSDEEIACYCHWATSVTAGGYNVSLSCPAGATFHTSESRSACLRETREQGACYSSWTETRRMRSCEATTPASLSFTS